MPTLRRSPITKLPQELVELIIAYFIHNTRALRACSLTCRSWYIAAVPHLHHTLTIDTSALRYRNKYLWPKPLQNSYYLGLLPIVKRLRIRAYFEFFTPKELNGYTLRFFSALTNLQELGIDHLQILYFIGLFPNLQDFRICYRSPKGERECILDADIVPLSVPPLCGRLALTCFAKEKLVKDMITFFGGLRFRYLDLFGVKCVRLLLGACADTLEGLRLYPTDPYADYQAMRWDFDLSRNSSLRTLETTVTSITVAGNVAAGFLKTVLSTINSTLPLDLLIGYGMYEVQYHMPCHIRAGNISPSERAAEALIHLKRFKLFNEMYTGR